MKAIVAALLLVHSWYPPTCCQDKDCHPVPCKELEHVPQGMMWKPLEVFFGERQIMESMDSYCHVCLSNPNSEGIPHIGQCVFVPKASS
jgi:hypothetical protein